VAVTRKVVVREAEKGRRVGVAFDERHAVENQRSTDATSGDADSSQATDGGRWPAYTAFGVGAAGLVVGAIFLVEDLSVRSTLAGECPGTMTCSDASRVDRQHTAQLLTIVGFGVAAVGVGIGTALLLTGGSPTASAPGSVSRAVRVTPRIGVGWVGIGGAFE
jgi:hypothetical protein